MMNALHKHIMMKTLAACMLLLGVMGIHSCSKVVKVEIPAQSQKVAVDGSIELNVPPIILLTKSQAFFGTINLNDFSNYFVHGANVKITGSDGSHVQLIEFCLSDLNLSEDQTKLLLSALGYTTIDSANFKNICAYTVPDIVTYYLTGTCSYMGKERTIYNLDIMSPPLDGGHDSIHVTSSTYIPTAIGMDSLVIKPATNAKYADSMASVYAYVTVPDTFGNFLRYKTKRNSQPYYNPIGGTVYDDRLFVGLTLGLPIERGQSPDANFDLNTDTYFWKGDTVTVKWSNIDSKTYRFFYTLENDGGGSPFSTPVKVISNINNGYGCWAGYATKYYTIIVPH